MLTFSQSVIERRVPISATYSTYPYEAGWAGEAVFFVQAEGAHPALSLQPEMSPDGINWVRLGASAGLAADEAIAALRLENFAGWLRLTITGATEAKPATVLIHLALKG
jgi:hypothetical protein